MQLTLRFADTQAARPRWRFNAAYGLNERMLIGVEYNPAVGEFNPTFNWTLAPHGEGYLKPLINFGTSSDRIFSPPGTSSYFLTFAKKIRGAPLSPYVSINYSEWESGFNLPFGLNWAVHSSWDLMMQNDGRNTHWLATYKQGNSNISLLLIKGRRPGLSLGWKLD